MKVLGMYFIVVGHMFPIGFKWVYVFSVPLFFFLSGALAKRSEVEWYKYISGINRSLIIPMLCFCILNLIYFILRYHIPFNVVILNIGKWFFRIAIGYQTSFPIGNSNFFLPGLGGCWFIYTFAILKIIHQFTPPKLQYIIILPLSIIFSIYLNLNGFFLGNSWANATIAYPVFLLGMGVKSKLGKLIDLPIKNILGWTLFIISTAIIVSLPFFNDWPQMYLNGYGQSIFLFFFGAISGIYWVYFIARLMDGVASKIIYILSIGNILTLGLHPFLVASLHGSGILNGIVDWGLAIVIMILMYPTIKFCYQYLPWLMGKRKHNDKTGL